MASVHDRNQQIGPALVDLGAGLLNWRLWTSLGWQDILLRYRRSVIGPFWLTLSLAIWVAAIGTLYSTIMRLPPEFYVPYLTAGMLVWGIISSLLIDGCQTFVSADMYIKHMGGAFSVYVYRQLWRNLLILLHNSVVYVAVAALFAVVPTANLLWLIPALVTILLNGAWVSMVFGLMSARFRDIPPIVQSVVQISFFVTPIIWHADQTGRSRFLEYNPFYDFVEIVRQPLLGAAPSARNWQVVGVITLLGCLTAFIAFARTRRRVAYWT